MTRPFHGYQTFLPYDLDLGVWTIFENFNFVILNFSTVSARDLIFHMSISYDMTLKLDQHFFDPMT